MPQIRFAAAVLLAGLASGPAFAQPAGMAQARQACQGDFKQFCPDVQPGGGRILACLKQNADKLSPACKQALVSMGGAAKAQKAGGNG